MVKKIEKLLSTTEEEKTKIVISTEIMEKTLKKIRMENMPKLDSELAINITSDIMKDEAINEFFKDVRKREISERKMRTQEREITAMMPHILTYKFSLNDFRLVDFQCALHEAASSRDVNDVRKLESLLENGADPNKCSNSGNTPLHNAIAIENLPAIKLCNRSRFFIKQGYLQSWHKSVEI